jgi:ATP-dependent Clp protease ATP-binding subunit ClpE
MLCSKCKKNVAVIFTNKIMGNKSELEGLCYNCAKELGIDPLEVLSKQANLSDGELTDMSSQLESIFNDLSDKIDPDTFETTETGETAIPFKSIISNMFIGNKHENNSYNNNQDAKKVKTEKKVKEKKKTYLDIYGTNLTNKAMRNELDAVIGRDSELQRIVQILNRRSKNNPCLIGEPGVGKTAIAQALAIKIAEKKVPTKLLNKEVYLLDMTAVIAGTQFRGQFEARMKGIMDECKSNHNIILVIDEIHNIIGAGDAEHSMNAANILKPSLANGDIQLIGTTTLKEYRKYIEKDSALERRFQPVIVDEPSVEDSIHILKGIKKYYEEFHKVNISDNVIEQTVKMSEKYIHDRFLPDKAIDVLDEACSRINLNNKELYELEILKQRLAEIELEKEEALLVDSTENYQKAANLKTEECTILDKITELNSKLTLVDLTVQDIAEVIEYITKIPVTKITEAETFKLLNLENNLHKRIIGQSAAVEAVSKSIRRNRAGLGAEKRPPSFIFVGPTGVRKNRTCKISCVRNVWKRRFNYKIRYV